MRILPLLSLTLCVACAACGSQPTGNSTAAADKSKASTSSAAKEAQALAALYLKHINAKDYEAARAMWGHGGADVGGSTQEFAKTFDIYSSYQGRAGDPTDIATTAGMDYVAVAATADVTLKKSGEKKTISGLIRFRRSIDAADKDPNGKKWTIWAVDVRKRQ